MWGEGITYNILFLHLEWHREPPWRIFCWSDGPVLLLPRSWPYLHGVTLNLIGISFKSYLHGVTLDLIWSLLDLTSLVSHWVLSGSHSDRTSMGSRWMSVIHHPFSVSSTLHFPAAHINTHTHTYTQSHRKRCKVIVSMLYDAAI